MTFEWPYFTSLGTRQPTGSVSVDDIKIRTIFKIVNKTKPGMKTQLQLYNGWSDILVKGSLVIRGISIRFF